MIKLTRANPLTDESQIVRLNERFVGAVEGRAGGAPGAIVLTTWGRMYVVRESVDAILRLMGDCE